MPISFHLTVSRAAAHAGETNRRVLRVRRANRRFAAASKSAILLLPASPRGESELPQTPPPTVVTTPRPTLDLSAPDARRPLAVEVPDDVDYEAFGGESPGFCPTGACRCGRCNGMGFRSSRYDYTDYARDYDGYGEEEDDYYDNGYVVPVYVQPTETYADAKKRICSTLTRYINVIGGMTSQGGKESFLLEMIRFLLDEPFMAEFLDKNTKFKEVLGSRMTTFGVETSRADVRVACGEVLGRFF
jgi:hypothetical protein